MDEASLPACSWALPSVALTVCGAGLDPDRVTERTGLEPTGTRKPGVDRWNPGRGAEGVWVLQYDERETPLFSEQLDRALGTAERSAEALASLAAEGWRVVFEVRGFTGHDARIAVSAADLARLAELGVPLALIPNFNER